MLYLVVDCPTDVLEVGVVEEVCVVLLHPLPDLEHADAPDLWQGVSVAMDEDGLEHVGEHVLDLVHVLLQLLPLRHEHLKPVCGPLVLALGSLAVILPSSVVQVD